MTGLTLIQQILYILAALAASAVAYGLRQLWEAYRRAVRLQRWRDEQTSLARRQTTQAVKRVPLRPLSTSTTSAHLPTNLEEKIPPSDTRASISSAQPRPPDHALVQPTRRAPSSLGRGSHLSNELAPVRSDVLSPYPLAESPLHPPNSAPVSEAPANEVLLDLAHAEPLPVTRGVKRTASMTTEGGNGLAQPNMRRRKLARIPPEGQVGADSLSAGQEDGLEESQEESRDESQEESQGKIHEQELNVDMLELPNDNSESSLSDESMDSELPEASELRTSQSADAAPARHDALASRSSAAKTALGTSNRSPGKAKSSSSKRTRDMGIDRKVAAARLRKNRARLPGDGVARHLHRVEEENLPSLDPGDSAEDLEGVRWRMGYDGKLRRLDQVRQVKNKYDMPRDSVHPDALEKEVVYTDSWLTVQEHDQAKTDLLLHSQKGDFDAKEAQRLASEAIAHQKRADRQRQKIEKQTEEARAAIERRKSVDRKLWGKLGKHGRSRQPSSTIGDTSNVDGSMDDDVSMSASGISHAPSRKLGSASVLDSSVSSAMPGRRAGPKGTPRPTMSTGLSEFGLHPFASTPNVSFNGSFRSRKRNEQVFHLETASTLAPDGDSSPRVAPTSTSNVPSISFTSPNAASEATTAPSASPATGSATFAPTRAKGEGQSVEPTKPTDPSPLFSFGNATSTSARAKPSEPEQSTETKPTFPSDGSGEIKGPTSAPSLAPAASKPVLPPNPVAPQEPSGPDQKKPVFSFAGPQAEAPKPPVATAPVFQFGAPPKPQQTGETSAPTEKKPVFAFGSSAAAAAPPTADQGPSPSGGATFRFAPAASATPTPTAQKDPPSKPTFTFGAPTSASSSSSTAPTSGFNFTPTFQFGKK